MAPFEPANGAAASGTTDSSERSQTSPKRKASEPAGANGDHGDDDGGSSKKKKRRKVNHACVYCRRSHMTCDLQRPCARCVKRDIGHLCHDEPRDPPKRSKSEVAEIAPAPDHSSPQAHVPAASMVHVDGEGGGQPQIVQPKPLSPNQLHRPPLVTQEGSNPLMNFSWGNNSGGPTSAIGGGPQNQFQDMHHLHPNYMFNTSEATNEYNLLNDFLSSSLLDDGAMYSTDDAQAIMNDPLLVTNSVNALSNSLQQQQQQQQQQQAVPNEQEIQQQQGTNTQTAPQGPPPPQLAGNEISRPSSAYPLNPVDKRARDKFYMTAADPAGLSSAEDRLHKLLKAKYDAGMLKPFNYVKGYARLNAYMEKHLSRESRLRILRQLERFRPKFREAMQSLTDIQLVLVEMWFERSLMEYDRVFGSMAIPACCWRRTGEIFRGNREMAELIDVPMEKLRDGKLAIHEIMEGDSLVSYWEKFGAIAFDQSQKAILTSCALRHPDHVVGRKDSDGKAVKRSWEVKKCCFSFTIRRDTHNIPALIVGNFLPITPRTDD